MRATICCLLIIKIYFSLDKKIRYLLKHGIHFSQRDNIFDTNSFNTHIDCLDYKITVSLCKSILKATKQGNLENLVKELASVPLHLFLLAEPVSAA